METNWDETRKIVGVEVTNQVFRQVIDQVDCRPWNQVSRQVIDQVDCRPWSRICNQVLQRVLWQIMVRLGVRFGIKLTIVKNNSKVFSKTTDKKL